jgi:dihydropteroate synthase
MHEWHLAHRVLRIGLRPLIMGIVNVTPDSFSDGGRFAATELAIRHGLDLVAQGADLLDIGGESTRPGATPVPLEEELIRVVPVVGGLAAQTDVPISIDTSKAEVARQCLAAGAQIVNDVTALTGDSSMAQVVQAARAGVILMHMQGTPQTMQINPTYDEVVTDIAHYLEERLRAAAAAGLSPEQIALDPGIGFGKTRAHNLTLLARLEEFQKLGRPVCLAISRKGFIGRVLDRPVDQRLAGELGIIGFAMSRRAVQIVRSHDVQATKDAVTMFAAIAENVNEPKA